MRNEPWWSQRGVLRSTTDLAAAGTLEPVAFDGDGAEKRVEAPKEMIPTTAEEFQAAFADVPHMDDPDPLDRVAAMGTFPDPVVPESGPIPDPQDHVTVKVETPMWALATAFDAVGQRLEQGDDPDREMVQDTLLDLASARTEWVLPDGSDAIDAILSALEEERE